MKMIREALTMISVDPALRGCRILFAVESGSRAWGFASPDSDYDVRFVYVRDVKDYLDLSLAHRDVFEADQIYDDFFKANNIDMVGWDLSKFLSLAKAGNAQASEWINSPIWYTGQNQFGLETLVRYYASRERLAEHYRGIAKSTHYDHVFGRDYGDIELKKLLYVIRGLAGALWAVEYDTTPPVLFMDLAEVLPREVRSQVMKVKEVKMSGRENSTVKLDHMGVILYWIKKTFEELPAQIAKLPKENRDWKMANQFFYDTVMRSSASDVLEAVRA